MNKQNPYSSEVQSPKDPEEKKVGAGGMQRKAIMGVGGVVIALAVIVFAVQKSQAPKPNQVEETKSANAPNADLALKRVKQDLADARRELDAQKRQAKIDAQNKALFGKKPKVQVPGPVPVVAVGPTPVDAAGGANSAKDDAWTKAREAYQAQVAQKYYAERMLSYDERLAARRAPMMGKGSGTLKTTQAKDGASSGPNGSNIDEQNARSLAMMARSQQQVQAQNQKSMRLMNSQNDRPNQGSNGQNASLFGAANPDSYGATGAPMASQMGSENPNSRQGFYNKNTNQAQTSTNAGVMLTMGTVIHVVLQTGVNSQLPGMVMGVVHQPVYDHSMSYVVIPSGSRLIGKYNAQTNTAQDRAQVVWNNLMFPSGAHVALPGFVGVDLSGVSGYQAGVDNHWDKLALGAGISAIMSASAAAISGPVNQLQTNPSQQAINGGAQPLQDVGEGIAQKYAKVDPTLTLKSGTLVGVLVTQNMRVPYQGGTP